MNWLWRFSHKLFALGICFRWLARFFELMQQSFCSNGVSSKCQIGRGTVFFHHGLGCVVHYNAIIGTNCKIFSNVVIGAKWSDGIRTQSAPIIGNNVMIGAGAVILGDITVEDNSIIGANSIVTKNVPSGSVVVGTNTILRNVNMENV